MNSAWPIKLRSLLTIANTRSFYDAINRNSTIYSLASHINAATGSPIGVVRMSGHRTSQVLKIITKKEPIISGVQYTSGQPAGRSILPRYATLSKIYAQHNEPDETIDEALVLWFPKPNSFTGEDVCEFHLHGAQSIISSLMATLATLDGCRPAEPGEFTRRAFENGKLDLTMAEAMADLIASKTDQQRKMALAGVSGQTRHQYKMWSERLTNILAHLEASIDFGEDELIGEAKVVGECLESLRRLKEQIEKHTWINSKRSELIRDGIKVTILGRPNAGKSTFMNLICQKDLSIVSDISGTTRDVIEHYLQLGGHAIKICDTAGLKTNTDRSVDAGLDPIEEAGIKRAFDKAQVCDIILYIVDVSTLPRIYHDQVTRISEELEAILYHMKKIAKERENAYLVCSNPRISIKVILNKIDKLEKNLEDSYLSSLMYDLYDRLKSFLIETGPDHVQGTSGLIKSITIDTISCKEALNLDKFISSLERSVTEIGVVREGEKIDDWKLSYLNERHLSHLRAIVKNLDRASTMSLESVDQMAQHVRECLDHVSRITGAIGNDEVLDVIFKDFCIGK